jgi:hypothetical protein
MNYKLLITNFLTVLVLSFIIYNLAFIIPVFAHVLQSDGSIGAVMHIDPDDDPIANSPATLYFDIKDKNGQFNVTKCNCRVDIYEGGKVIYSSTLTPAFPYTFPGKDVYQIHLVGSPQSPGDFPPFNIIYDIRVDKTSSGQTVPQNSNWFSSHLYLMVGIGVILAVFGLAFVKKPKKE